MWLTNAGLVIDTDPPVSGIKCPGSPSSAGTSKAPRVGYEVKVSLRATADHAGWLLGVEKSCVFVNHGRGRSGYAEGCEWEIRKVAGHWNIVHWTTCRVT